ncbi:hypothetical protein AIOL_000660 [Candidatus Rhodobacter oscarellae]|uniref:Uncharacterized protein n=1 Tax=Candidatus Rhodobacter oscarellae TaxID=1675527 RepID=A0A0J9EFP9_9RHOB|nr:hypothetical protein [Candidatus Rhodobacter lobularis]KMW60504.1 hypothetical protein AIOL_000660 [Candidatus Rhodobacter lobularis]
MIFCTAHRYIPQSMRSPSEIAMAEPRRKAPVRAEQRRFTYSDWAAV